VSRFVLWFRRRREAAKLVNADAEALMRDHGGAAYWEARRRERDVVLPDGTTHQGHTPAHWRRVALVVAKRTGHAVGLDTATRMVMARDPSPPSELTDPEWAGFASEAAAHHFEFRGQGRRSRASASASCAVANRSCDRGPSCQGSDVSSHAEYQSSL
jgi:hypothetical protein